MAMQVKVVRGFQSDAKSLTKKLITLRYTRDQSGETLSIDNGEIMLGLDAAIIRNLMGVKR